MKRYTLCIFTALALCACQKTDFDNGRDFDEGTVRYAVAFGAAESDGSATKSSGTSDVTRTNLSDESGNVSIAMASRSTEGIEIVAPAPLTKGQQVNTTGNDNTPLSTFKDKVSSFVVKAYDAGVEEVSQTVSWSTTTSSWVATPTAYWPQTTNLSFFAYANLPTGQSASISSSGVSTSHTVPSDISKQTDILFGHYEGDGGDTGTAEIRFEHPLTAVRFLYGTMKDNPTVKSISLKGVAQTGTAKLTSGGIITWSNVGTRNATLTQQNASGLSLTPIGGYTSELIGDTFLIIPQDLAENNVTVSVVFTDGTKVEAKIDTGEWKAGYTNTYVLGYSGGTPILVLDLGEGTEDELSFSFNGGSKAISINSIIQDELEATIGNEPWTAELEFEGAGKDDPWVHLDKTSGEGGLETITLSTEQNVVTIKNVAPDDVWNDLKNAAVSGTADNRTDLSGGGETANCYLVNAPGYYKLPLVYGNARKSDGTANTDAFNPTGLDDKYKFTDHKGTVISGPNIYDKYTPASCCLIWEDEPDLIRNVSLSEDGHYLQFDIDKTSIYEGNAIVAVRDAAGAILWSWHIWVTNYTMGTGDGAIEIATPQVPSTGQRNIVKYTFAGRPVGFCNPKTISYEGGKDYARCTITIKQASGNEISFVVYNEEGESAAGSNVTYFQWGRKDPMPGGYVTAKEGYYAAKSNKPLYYDDAAYTFTQDNSRQSRGYSIQNPHKLIYHYSASGGLGEAADWENTTTTRFNAWNATSVGRTNGYNFKLANYKEYGVYTSVKSVYDPSPAGYKVPVHYPFLLFVPKLGSDPTNPTTVDGTYVTTPVEGYKITALEPVNSGDPATFFPRTAFRAQATGLDNGSWGVFATCSPSATELKSATFGFTASAGGTWNATDGCPNNVLGLFIATAVQPIREETVTEQTMANQVLFEDNFVTTASTNVASYDGAGMSGKPYNFKDALSYSGGSNTSVSTSTTTNMTEGHLRYSSNSNNNTSTFTIANVRTYGAKSVTLTFDAYINNTSYISTHTVSVGGLTAKNFSSQKVNSFTFDINGDDPVDIVFNIKHNNSSNTGTVGIDNVKLTFTN